MKKQICLIYIMSISLSFLSFNSFTQTKKNLPAEPINEGNDVKAIIISIDSSIVEVSNFRFDYNITVFQGPTYYNTEKISSDFAYREVVNNVQINKIIPCDEIDKIEFCWIETKYGYRSSPDSVYIFLKNQKKITIKRENLKPTAEFFLNKPANEIDNYNGSFSDLYITGVGKVGDHEGLYDVRLYQNPSGSGLKIDPRIKTIIFTSTED